MIIITEENMIVNFDNVHIILESLISIIFLISSSKTFIDTTFFLKYQPLFPVASFSF